jgi:hypothetical protein
MTATWMSIDPALGGGNAVMVVEPTTKCLYVVDCRIDYGLSKTEQQIEILTTMARRYKPSLLIVETDSQQKGLGNDDRLAAVATMLGFTIRPHLTRSAKSIKSDPVYHVAAMNQSFVKQEISIPWADEDTRRRMEPLVHQLRMWRPDIPTKKLRQDAVMALWFVWREWMKVRDARRQQPVAQDRPSWMRNSRSPVLRTA